MGLEGSGGPRGEAGREWGGPRGRLISQLDVPEKFRKLVVDFGGLSFVLTLTDTVFRPTHPFRMKVLYLKKTV